MLHLNCTALSQSESSNFFMCIIRADTSFRLLFPGYYCKQKRSFHFWTVLLYYYLSKKLNISCSPILTWLIKTPLSVRNCWVPTTRFTQTLLLCYSIITAFHAFRRSNGAKSIREICINCNVWNKVKIKDRYNCNIL